MSAGSQLPTFKPESELETVKEPHHSSSKPETRQNLSEPAGLNRKEMRLITSGSRGGLLPASARASVSASGAGPIYIPSYYGGPGNQVTAGQGINIAY